MATKYNLVVDQGSDFNLKLSFKTNDEVRDLTEYNIRGQARSKNELILEFITSRVSSSTFLLRVPASISDNISPGTYNYSIQLYGNGYVDRVLEGVLEVTGGVTK